MAPLPLANLFVVGDADDGYPDDRLQMAQCGSDDLLGPMDDIVLAHEERGVDFGAGVAAVTAAVPTGGPRRTTLTSRFAC